MMVMRVLIASSMLLKGRPEGRPLPFV